MKILAFDTSNAYSSVAISEGGEILYGFKDYTPNTQAERLVIHIENALKEAGLTYEDLDYIAVSRGPGSFTGIRIALAAARALILASGKIKPVSVTNFDTINFRIREQFRNFAYAISVVNAYRDQLYVQVFEKKTESDPKLLSYKEFEDLIKNLKGNIAIAGSGIEKLFDINKEIPNNITVLPRFPYPDARIICRVSNMHILKNRENREIEPLYIRLPDAKLPKIKLL